MVVIIYCFIGCKDKTSTLYLNGFPDGSMYGHHIQQSMDQPGKVANPARGQLNRENECSPVPVHALEFGLARRIQPSRPASVCSFSILRLNLVLTHGIPPDFRGGVHLFV